MYEPDESLDHSVDWWHERVAEMRDRDRKIILAALQRMINNYVAAEFPGHPVPNITVTKFIDEEELEGRTIAQVVEEDSRLFILFTDGTWTNYGTAWGYYGSHETGFDPYANIPKSLRVT